MLREEGKAQRGNRSLYTHHQFLPRHIRITNVSRSGSKVLVHTFQFNDQGPDAGYGSMLEFDFQSRSCKSTVQYIACLGILFRDALMYRSKNRNGEGGVYL